MAHTGSQEAQYLIIKMALGIERSGRMAQAHGCQHFIQNSGICVTQEPPHHHSPTAVSQRPSVGAGSCAYEPFVAQGPHVATAMHICEHILA